MDAGNMLKPMLARGELRMVGATTLDEYRKHIEKDAALERRFQPVLVGEPSVQDTIAILRGLKERYEVHHGVRIQDSALVAAAVLSDRYVTGRFLPDKAIDLVDEAGSRLRIEIDSMPTEVDVLERRARQLEIERAALRKENDEVVAGAAGQAGGGAGLAAGDPHRHEVPLGGREGGHRGHPRDQRPHRGGQGRGRAGDPGRAPGAGGRAALRRPARPGARPGRGQPAPGRAPGRPPDAQGGGRRGGRGQGRVRLDRHPRDPARPGRDGQAAAARGRAAPAGGRPGRRRPGGRRRHPALAGRAVRAGPADRQLPVPRAHRGRQDRAGQGPGRAAVRRRAGHGPHRHERVRREALGGPAGRGAPRLRRLRRGRPAHRGGAAPALCGGAAGRGREGPPGRVQRPAPGDGRRPPDRRPGPHRRLLQRGPDHDLQPRARRCSPSSPSPRRSPASGSWPRSGRRSSPSSSTGWTRSWSSTGWAATSWPGSSTSRWPGWRPGWPTAGSPSS